MPPSFKNAVVALPVLVGASVEPKIYQHHLPVSFEIVHSLLETLDLSTNHVSLCNYLNFHLQENDI